MASSTTKSSSSSSTISPFYDVFLDLPHPAASKSCPPVATIWNKSGEPSELSSSVGDLPSTVSGFAFPEYTPPTSNDADQTKSKQLPLNKYDIYAMQNVGFQSFTFTLQLQTGMRLHGHVRRYLPTTPIIINSNGEKNGKNSTSQSNYKIEKFCPRYDVGRRGERALVLLTRASGADRLSDAVLKSVQAIQELQQQTNTISKENNQKKDTSVVVKEFLMALSCQQEQLAKAYANKPNNKGKPLMAMIAGLEFHDTRIYGRVDVHKFLVPTCLLLPQQQQAQQQVNQDQNKQQPQQPDIMATCAILPVFRCIGIAHGLRILAALLCERRVVLISSSPTRLTSCSHAVLAMLSCGLLQWQHLYIPVLPPHLWQYLAAPYPYLIGILAHMSGKLSQTDGLGEVLILNLDTNQMEARGFDTNVIPQKLPDLFAIQDPTAFSSLSNETNGGAAGGTAYASASEALAQDLGDLLKTDKRLLYGESSFQQNVGETAAKAAQSVKKTFFKLRDKGRQYLQNRNSNSFNEGRDSNHGSSGGGGSSEMQASESAATAEAQNTLAPDYIYTEACYNESCESEARLAFTMFFMCMYGNMRWYLSASTTPGQVPQLDRQRFLQQKRAMGDGQGTPMWSLLQGFCQTQMLEEFAKARVEEVRTRKVMTSVDAPLFSQCAQVHRQQNIDFGLLSVRRVAMQVWQSNSNSTRITGMIQSNARKNAMVLTSNKPYEGGDYNQAIAQLVEECRESTCVLLDVMSVLWLRLRDCKGGQWKHGLQALQMMRNLLYHGPLAAVSEATDGLDKIRALKYYENGMRQQAAQQVRSAAQVVYSLLVDRARLFSVRRFCAHRRMELLQPKPRPARDRRFTLTAPFRSLHNVASPTAGGTIVRIPPTAASSATMRRSDSGMSSGSSQQQQAQQDLLGLSAPPPSAAPARTTSADDIFGLSTPTTAPQPAAANSAITPSTNNAAQDVMGMFDSMSVSSASTGTGQSPPQQPVPPSASATAPFVPQQQQQQQQAGAVTPSAHTPPPPPQQQQMRQVPPSQYAQRAGMQQQPGPPPVQPQPTYAQLPAVNQQQRQPQHPSPQQGAPGQQAQSYAIPTQQQPQQPSHPYGAQPPNAQLQQQQQKRAQFDPFSQKQTQQVQQVQQPYPGTGAGPAVAQYGAPAPPPGQPQQQLAGNYQQQLQPQQQQPYGAPGLQPQAGYPPHQQPAPPTAYPQHQQQPQGTAYPQQQQQPPPQQQPQYQMQQQQPPQQRVNPKQFDPFA